jgi:hypothetical protein
MLQDATQTLKEEGSLLLGIINLSEGIKYFV